MISIVEAMDDGELFEPWFRGASWDGWRAVLKAAFALPMSAEEVAFFRSIAGDRDPPRRRVRELWCIVGRRGGKDSIASLIAAHAAALFDQEHRLGSAKSRDASLALANLPDEKPDYPPTYAAVIARRCAQMKAFVNGPAVPAPPSPAGQGRRRPPD